MGGESATTGALERTNQLGGELLKVTVRDSPTNLEVISGSTTMLSPSSGGEHVFSL